VVGWRIIKQKHASTAFSGDGARLFEGRWNSVGVRIVYCSEHLSLATLEILVHTQPVVVRDKYRAFQVTWDAKLMAAVGPADLLKGWNAFPPTKASKKVGDQWIKAGRNVVLAVPSAIVPLERTFLLNPAHPDFAKIKIKDVGAFVLDPRLRR
jgi:RES domain-containing protein